MWEKWEDCSKKFVSLFVLRSTTDCDAKQHYCTLKFTAILGSGIKKLGQKLGSVFKKYTLLLPWLLCRIETRFQSSLSLVDVVVQFYPWFKFSFLLFQTHYHVIIIHYHTQKQKKRKFEPRIKLNHNIDIVKPNLLQLLWQQ